jgi:nitrilase
MVVRAAIIQARAGSTLDAALVRADALAGDAAKGGATLVVFPETWIPGYPAWLDHCRDTALWDHPPVKRIFAQMADSAVDVRGESGARLAAIAARHGVTMVIGVTERVASGPGRGTLYNAALTYSPEGRLLNHHRKLVPTYTERMVWGNGDAAGLAAVDTPAGRVGGLICWEHWMPLARQGLHDSGEDIHVALWPNVRDPQLLASRHYAFEGRCYALAAGSIMRARDLPAELEPAPDRFSSPDDFVLRGGSTVIAPNGDLLAGPIYDEETILFADLPLARIREESMNLDVSGHYARPDCFDFTVRRTTRRL